MARRRAGRGLLVATCLLAFLGSACSPSSPAPDPPPPTVSAAPTETAQEREERVAYEAAEKSYREFSGEFRRVTASGGAKSATSRMRATAAGPYLADALKVIQAYKETGGYTSGRARFGYLRPAGYSKTSILLDVCEDESKVKTFDSKRKQVATNGILVLRLDVRMKEGSWKVWDYTGKEAKSCD